MKPNLHPEYKEIKVTCSCGSEFITRSTLGKDSYHLEVCSLCHPFYTGTQKIMDTAGRVDRFRQKYGMKTAGDTAAQTEAKPVAAKEPAKEEAKVEAKKEAKPAAKKEPKAEAKKDAKPKEKKAKDDSK